MGQRTRRESRKRGEGTESRYAAGREGRPEAGLERILVSRMIVTKASHPPLREFMPLPGENLPSPAILSRGLVWTTALRAIAR